MSKQYFTRRQALGIGVGGALVGAAATTGLPRLYDALVNSRPTLERLEHRIAKHATMLGDRYETYSFDSLIDLEGGEKAVVKVINYYEGEPRIKYVHITGPDGVITHRLGRDFILPRGPILEDNDTKVYIASFTDETDLDMRIGILTSDIKRKIIEMFADKFRKIDEAYNVATERKRIQAKKFLGTR